MSEIRMPKCSRCDSICFPVGMLYNLTCLKCIEQLNDYKVDWVKVNIDEKGKVNE